MNFAISHCLVEFSQNAHVDLADLRATSSKIVYAFGQQQQETSISIVMVLPMRCIEALLAQMDSAPKSSIDPDGKSN
jgi:hypothetical protein